MDVWLLLAFFWSGACVMAIGVAGGGILVLITKREAHEIAGLLGKTSAEEPTAINIDEDYGSAAEQPEEEADPVPDLFFAKHHDFLSQVAKDSTISNAS